MFYLGSKVKILWENNSKLSSDGAKEKRRTESRKKNINAETNAISAIGKDILPRTADTIDTLEVPLTAGRVRAGAIVTEETIETEGTTGTETMIEIAIIGEIAIESTADTLNLTPANPVETTDANQNVRTTGVETDILLKREAPTTTLVANIDRHILTE